MNKWLNFFETEVSLLPVPSNSLFQIILHSNFQLPFRPTLLCPCSGLWEQRRLRPLSCWQGTVSGPVLFGFVSPWVNFACGSLAPLICCWCSMSFMFWERGVQHRVIAARSLGIFPCCCWEPTAPGLSVGPPYPLLWSSPHQPQAVRVIIPSTRLFPIPGTIGTVGAGGALKHHPPSLVLTSCHSCPSAATLCCQWVLWKWLLLISWRKWNKSTFLRSWNLFGAQVSILYLNPGWWTVLSGSAVLLLLLLDTPKWAPFSPYPVSHTLSQASPCVGIFLTLLSLQHPCQVFLLL